MTVQAETEIEVRRLYNEGTLTLATALTIRAYGPEILGFLMAQHRDSEDASEIFSIWSERVLRGLPTFGWASSLRTWTYTLAKNASINFVRSRRVRARREEPAHEDEILLAEQQVRTATPLYMRTEARDKLNAIRDALPPEDRMLLVLRVDKRLEWKDLSRVMLGEGADITDLALTKESQRLRKRFQLLKEKLLEAGKRAGILDDPKQLR